MIYFDHSATSPMYPEALQTYQQVSQDFWGNPSSLHKLGVRANTLLQQARKQLAELIGVSADELYLTSGGTESNNWVFKGLVAEKGKRHLIISAIEHPSVSQTALFLQQQGCELTIVPVDNHGRVDVDQIIAAIRPDTMCVSVMAVNNEVGVVQPIQALAEALRAFPQVHFHVDGVQAIGHVPLLPLHERIDFFSMSAHKFGGPRGVGLLVKRHGRRLAPLLHGGGQEMGWRSGTEHLPAIAAMAKALRMTLAATDNTGTLRAQLIAGLSRYTGVQIFDSPYQAPHILAFAIVGVRGEVLVHAFEEHDIYLSTTSACSSRANQPHHTLAAMNVPGDLSRCVVRLSMSHRNTVAEVATFLTTFEQVYHQFSRVREK